MTKASSRATSARAARSSWRPLRCGCWRAGELQCPQLVALDLLGLLIGLYVTPCEGVVGTGTGTRSGAPSGRPRRGPLPFLAPLSVLVFSQRGLYARRERRGGLGTILSSLTVVAILALAYQLGTDKNATTYTAFPAGVSSAAGDRPLPRELREHDAGRLPQARRAAPRHPRRRGRVAAPPASAARPRTRRIDYAFVVSCRRDPELGLPLLGSLESLAGDPVGRPGDELIVTDDFKERELLEIVEHAHRRGLRVRVAPKTTELLVTRGEYTPQQGPPALRAAPAGPDRHGLDHQARLRPPRQHARHRRRRCRSGS